MPIIGAQQSPIKIVTEKTFYANFEPDYLTPRYTVPQSGEYDLVNFEFKPPAEDHADPIPWTMMVDGKPWYIRKIHIHSKAEHLLDSDVPVQLEVHLLHSAPGDPHAEREKLAIGVFVVEDPKAKKPSIAELAKRLSASRNKDGEQDCTATVLLNPAEFLPDNMERWFHYEGSLTSHPYTEDVTWYVMREVAGVPKEALDILKRCAHQERRPVFPLDRRYVLRSFA